MKLAIASILAASATATDWSNAAVCSDCNATCNDDQTLTIVIPYTRTAQILDLEYGNCNASSAGVTNTAQAGDNSFTVNFDMARCDMDSRLRAIEYDQTVANIKIGMSSNGMQLEFARYQFNTWCSYDDTYEVIFDYGTLTTDKQTFNETGGEIGYVFLIQAYDSAYNAVVSSPTNKGGEMIYLSMTTNSSHFDTATKKFAPVDCAVQDMDNVGLNYTLFTTDSNAGCTNSDISFSISYNESDNSWRFEHVLFLLGNHEQSTFRLVCNVVVCDYDNVSSSCNDIAGFCGTSYTG